MCNPSDLGTECANPKDTRYFPERLLVYDRHPGGIGIAAQVPTCRIFEFETNISTSIRVHNYLF